MSERVLIVEDEVHLAEGLRFNLEAEGYAVDIVESGEAALARTDVSAALTQPASPPRYDAILLDVMLPGIDGFEVARTLRARGIYVPLLMLTARGRSDDILKGLEAGADDYVTKPFELAILLARLRGLLRRKQWSANSAPDAPRDIFRFDGRTIDFTRLVIDDGNTQTPLTVMEADLLRELVRNEGTPVSRKALLERVWGLREDTDTRAIDNFIVRLRRYVEQDPAHPKHLLTVRGVGYRFVANSAPAIAREQ
jgi:DNA-binding response OmpR family regulator